MRRLSSLLLLTALITFGQQQTSPDNLAPYLPTPPLIVERMLQAGHLKEGETMFDLGSGDGRIVIAAAKNYKANAIGVELDDTLAATSAQRIAEMGLEKNARIIHGDLLKQDYSSADLITVYLWPEANRKVAQLLDLQLKKGARVVSHDFEILSWKPNETITIDDDGTGRSHTLFVYIR